GGEPLVRNNILWLIERLGALPDLRELTITTNGSQLPKLARSICAAGVKRLNISLDSLRADRFQRITRTGDLNRVLAGIDAARAEPFRRIKLNSVIMRNRNEDEILDLVRFCVDRDLDISFIEEMPLGDIEHERAESYFSSDEVRAEISRHYELVPSTHSTGGPSRYFEIKGTGSKVGFISPHSHNFCESCNRVRVTVQGRLLLCLGQEHSMDLRRVLRANPGDEDALKQALRDSMAIKPKGHDFDLNRQVVIFRHMSVTGG
ncbi:MAG: GTP 3',8-cyclase MoaA, partial [Gammaproteobacteria bacterium]|nr:GTP 3',8-cyclase MoaA [Gammaproteobacteria bacterium]